MKNKTKTSNIFFGLGAVMIMVSFAFSNPYYMERPTPPSITFAITSFVLAITGTVFYIKKK